MCGIGGFSLSDNSKLNSRKLSNVMLGLLEVRGSQASGAAWHANSSCGYIKRDVRGSALNLRSMPRRTQAVILHTRLATHGSTSDQRNNHPVLSPDNSIKLVHNGVIYNHDQVRTELNFKLPKVDTSVIPALLQQEQLAGIAKLDGDASIAWLSDDRLGDLHLARIEHSPLAICQVKDGSFFFASTEEILNKFLKKMKLTATFFLKMPERLGYTIRRGVIVETLEIPELDPAYEYNWARYSNKKSGFRTMTAGGKGGMITPYDWNSHLDHLPEPMSEMEANFQDWLDDNFLYTNGEYFTYDGYFAGDRSQLLETFERYCYDQEKLDLDKEWATYYNIH